GGTVAGLVAGLRTGGLASRVVGVLVTDILPPSARRLLRLARSCLAPPRPAPRGGAPSPRDPRIERGLVGPRDGAVTPEGEAAGRLAEHHQGIALDSTYTAKCLAALLHHGTSRTLRGKPLLFWNTFSSVEPAVAPAPPGSLPAPFRRFL